MPRPKRPGAPPPKPRSRHGCWSCKRSKIKCSEEKPSCANCVRKGHTCDYSIRLNWDGRTKRKASEPPTPNSNYAFETLSTSFQPSPLAAVQDAVASVDTFSPIGKEWSDTSSPYANNMSHPWISQGTPISTAPVLARRTPSGCDAPNAVSSDHSVFPTMTDQTLHSSAVASSMAARDNYQSFGQSIDSSIDANRGSAGFQFMSFSPHGFEGINFSQPVSFLRDTSTAAGMDLNTRIDSNMDRVKRHKKEDLGGHDHRRHMSLDHDAHRMSVNSLLARAGDNALNVGSPTSPQSRRPVVSGHEIFYGYDCGTPDYDLKNNDAEAIAPINPSEEAVEVFDEDPLSPLSEQTPTGSLHVRRRSSFTTGGGYYIGPVRVKIPRRLTPLPATLLDNPINLLYFHHFIDHTARLLAPHDCDQNPFLRILPAMAMSDPNLLNLMLAYSASHRARFLRHPEPSNRIAHWVRDVFPTLRHALNAPESNVTDSHLATSIMLLSLKIVSPSTFEVPITWQTHLKLARDLFVARENQGHVVPSDRVSFFLAQWFGYLDIVGSLSCRHSGAPLSYARYRAVLTGNNEDWEHEDDESMYRVDCFNGYTPINATLLERLAQLTHQCDNERFDDGGNFLSDWIPPDEMQQAGRALLEDLRRARQRGHIPGTHHTELEDNEMYAIDQAFHWSAVLHTHRRVLGNTSYSEEISEAVDRLCQSVAAIRPGSSTECSVLWPLFTAGCESRDPQQRLDIMTRVMNFETEGLKQFKNARKLMQRCWDEDLPWLALAHGEFLG